MRSISSDGYVRLSMQQLQATQFTHLISGMDEDSPMPVSSGALATAITGYTEWISEGNPALTVGWDWQLGAIIPGTTLRRVSEPRSNILLLDAASADHTPAASEKLLGAHIDTLDWQQVVQDYLNQRYTAA
jgi:hypothetical protein